MRPASDIRDPTERTGIDDVRRMYGEARVDAGPWLVSVGLPMSLALNRAASLWARSFAILAFGLAGWFIVAKRSEEHTSELQSLRHLVCRLLLEKKKKKKIT